MVHSKMKEAATGDNSYVHVYGGFFYLSCTIYRTTSCWLCVKVEHGMESSMELLRNAITYILSILAQF